MVVSSSPKKSNGEDKFIGREVAKKKLGNWESPTSSPNGKKNSEVTIYEPTDMSVLSELQVLTLYKHKLTIIIFNCNCCIR